MRLTVLLCALAFSGSGFADDGFIWIDANTRIKVKPTKAGTGATAPEKEAPKPEKKEKARK